MFKKNKIQPLVEDRPKAARTGGAVDHIAAATGVPILVLGVAQLVAPVWTSPLTAIEPGTGAAILGVLWAVLGGLLTIGGVLRTRVVTIFAAEFVLITALAALAVILFTRPEFVPLLVHGAMAFFGLLSSGFARLTDKADLKQELRLMREQVSLVREAREIESDNQTNRTTAAPTTENINE